MTGQYEPAALARCRIRAQNGRMGQPRGEVQLHATAGAALGRFDLPADDPRWTGTNHVGPCALVALPGTPVRIRHLGRRPDDERVCDATQLVVYAAGQDYRRRALVPAGDHCLFVRLDEDDGLRLTTPPPPVVPCPASAYLAAHALRRRLAAGMSALAADEAMTTLAEAVLAAVRGAPAPDPALRASSRDLVEDAKAVLARRYAEPLTLAGIAREVSVSPFHLARVFRAVTGTSLHAHRTGLRLRHLAATGEPRRLATMAVEVGFASHSHMTERFRTYFGTTPSSLTASASPTPAGS